MRFARRTAAAERDLQEIAFQIAVRAGRPIVADRNVDGLVGKCQMLPDSGSGSHLGTDCPELGDGVRLFSFKRWVIVFRYAEHGIDVLRFADCSQDYLAWRL